MPRLNNRGERSEQPGRENTVLEGNWAKLYPTNSSDLTLNCNGVFIYKIYTSIAPKVVAKSFISMSLEGKSKG